MTDKLLLAREGRVLIATNNDPATRNALSWDFYDGFKAAVEDASKDPTIGAIVVTGAGGFVLARCIPLGSLDLFPLGDDLFAVGERTDLVGASEDVGMAPDEFIRECVQYVFNGKATSFGGDLAVEDDL